jgi:hypothetical protein
MDAMTKDAKLAGTTLRLKMAKESVKTLKAQQPDTPSADRDVLRSKLGRIRSGGTSARDGLMMAPRKGGQLSQSDEEGALDDLAQLEAIEAQEDEASKE